MERRQRLLALYEEFPFEHHPMWVAKIEQPPELPPPESVAPIMSAFREHESDCATLALAKRGNW
jgi:hypothetical protein